MSILYSEESELLGTAGAVKKLSSELKEEPFFVIYGDNYFPKNYNLNKICQKHRNNQPDMSIAFFQLEDVRLSGIAVLDDRDWVSQFIEKPQRATAVSDWVNAGLYLMEPQLLASIPDGYCDFGREVIPQFLEAGKKILGVRMKSKVVAIDTPKLLKIAMSNQ